MIINSCKKAKNNGFILSCMIILGLGGRKYSNMHAIDTSTIINEIQPNYLGALTLYMEPEIEKEFYAKFKEPFQPLEDLEILNEIEGAYVFRLGFPDDLKLYGFDSSRYFAVNFLPRQDLEKMKEESSLVNRKGEINLPPDIVLKQREAGNFDILDHGVLKYTVAPGEHIFYWNVNRLDEIQAGTLRSPD